MPSTALRIALVSVVVGAVVAILTLRPSGPDESDDPGPPEPAAAEAPRQTEIEERPSVLAPVSPHDREAVQAALEQIREFRARSEAELRRHAAELPGEPTPWPEGLDENWSEERFVDRVEKLAVLEGVGNIEIIDCEEFPCLAVLSHPDQTREWKDDAYAAVEEMARAEYGPRASVSVWVADADDGQVAGFSISPPEALESSDRAKERMEIWLDEMGVSRE